MVFKYTETTNRDQKECILMPFVQSHSLTRYQGYTAPTQLQVLSEQLKILAPPGTPVIGTLTAEAVLIPNIMNFYRSCC